MIFAIDESTNDLKHVEDLVQLDTTTKMSQFQVHVPWCDHSVSLATKTILNKFPTSTTTSKTKLPRMKAVQSCSVARCIMTQGFNRKSIDIHSKINNKSITPLD